MAHVLIGFAEALPAPEVVFSLLNAGHQVSAFARSATLPLAHLPLQRLVTLPPPEQDAEACVAALVDLMAAPDAPDVLLPLDDTGVWLIDVACGKSGRSAGATGAQARAALDKSIQVAAAARAGLPVPETVIVQQPADLDCGIPLPTIAKPALAVQVRAGRIGKAGPVYLSRPEDIDAFRQQMLIEPGPYLIQPLIQGIGEGIFGLATDTGVVAWSGHRRLRMMNPHGSGSSACIAIPPDETLKAGISAFLAEIGWRGPFMVELLRDENGTPWFMELNGRMWGSLALARRLGLDYPAWALALHENPDFRPVVPVLPPDPIVQRNLGREILHLLFVLRGPKSSFHRAGWPSFWTSLTGVLRPAHPSAFYNYDPKHPGFFLRDAWWTVKKALVR